MQMWPSWANWKTWLKAIGLLFLVAYFWIHPPHLDIIWISAYVGLAIGIGAMFALIANPILVRLIPTQHFDPSPYGDKRIAQAKRRPWTEALLLAGEDGFFFVPILLLGINPVSAAVVAVAYAAIHYPEFPLKYCITKAILIFLIATLILPNGLASVIVGHLLLDVFAYHVWSRGLSQPATVENDGR